MDLLRSLGISRKKLRPVGQNLERGREDKPQYERNSNLIKVVVLAVLVFLTLWAYPSEGLYQYTVEVDDFWRQETLIAPYDFAVYKDENIIEEERNNVKFTTPPYFAEVSDARQRMEEHENEVSEQLSRLFEIYDSYQEHLEEGELEQAQADSVRLEDFQRNARLVLDDTQWQMLYDSYAAQQEALEQNIRPVPERLDEVCLKLAIETGLQFINIGIMDVPQDTVLTDEILIRNEERSTVQPKKKENLFGINEAFDLAQDQFVDKFPENPVMLRMGRAFFQAVFVPSLTYLRAETLRDWREKTELISPTRGMVAANSVIVSNGERITPEIKRRITSLEREQIARSGRRLPWRMALGQFMLTLSVYFVFFLYLYILRRPLYDDIRTVLVIALQFCIVIFSFAVAVRSEALGIYVVPVAVAPVMMTVLFDSRIALIGLFSLAFLGGLLTGYDLEFTFATVLAGTFAIFSVRDIKNRGQIFLSAGVLFVGYAIVLGATWLLYDTPREVFLGDLTRVAINAVLLISSLPLLWVFERTFGITTDLTLLELSDTNRPLLKELSVRAPGSFNHSLQVANLAEAAADAIGANALLTRVGALYHDVGKMIKPEYFVENQRFGDNPHNQLKPRMSALIIASHVKDGLELAREYNLPKQVTDFIPMHHGTTLIEYFYRKAEESATPDEAQSLESEFRYPGPKPDSKETGILMLADAVEAASRSIKEPTHKRLEGVIESIFEARAEDGQLDSSQLTFRELNVIKDTFLSMLLGIHHGRVKYPGQELKEARLEEENNTEGSGDGAAGSIIVEQ